MVLPLLESIAAHAPVVFRVQENSPPEYDPLSIVSTLYASESSSLYSITQKVNFDVSTFTAHLRHGWFHNGGGIGNSDAYNITLTDGEGTFSSNSLQVKYNGTDEIAGSYFATINLEAYYFMAEIQCLAYSHYLLDIAWYAYSSFPLGVSYWSILPSSE